MVSIDAATLRLGPIGELTIYKVEELTKEMAASLLMAKEVLIDLSETEKIDTAGFQLLVSLKKSCMAMDKKCETIGISLPVENFMALFGYECDLEERGRR